MKVDYGQTIFVMYYIQSDFKAFLDNMNYKGHNTYTKLGQQFFSQAFLIWLQQSAYVLVQVSFVSWTTQQSPTRFGTFSVEGCV